MKKLIFIISFCCFLSACTTFIEPVYRTRSTYIYHNNYEYIYQHIYYW